MLLKTPKYAKIVVTNTEDHSNQVLRYTHKAIYYTVFGTHIPDYYGTP